MSRRPSGLVSGDIVADRSGEKSSETNGEGNTQHGGSGTLVVDAARDQHTHLSVCMSHLSGSLYCASACRGRVPGISRGREGVSSRPAAGREVLVRPYCGGRRCGEPKATVALIGASNGQHRRCLVLIRRKSLSPPPQGTLVMGETAVSGAIPHLLILANGWFTRAGLKRSASLPERSIYTPIFLRWTVSVAEDTAQMITSRFQALVRQQL